ncbi:hypothetical protein GBF38_002553, partial [Nibea albiflora]
SGHREGFQSKVGVRRSIDCQTDLLRRSEEEKRRRGRMNGGKSALPQPSARQSVTCSEPNCTARYTTETLALSAAPAWSSSGNGSTVDAYRHLELQLPASDTPTVGISSAGCASICHRDKCRSVLIDTLFHLHLGLIVAGLQLL